MKYRSVLTLVFVAALAAILAGQAPSQNAVGDWPQWRGPKRDGVSRETGLLQAWPADGPRLVWSIDTLGSGLGSIAVKGDRIYVLGTNGRESIIASLNRADGKKVWQTRIGWIASVPATGPGPKSTPTVDGDRVYAISEAGDLACLTVRDGKLLWTRNLLQEFNAAKPTWLVAESPLVDGDRVYASPGAPHAGMVAFDKMTGKTVWKTETLGSQAAYASMIAADVQGVRTLMTLTLQGGVGVRASDGKVMWKDPRPPTVESNIATPIFFDNKVLYAYDTGLSLLALTAESGSVTAKPIYFSTDLGIEWGGAVLVNGYVYAFNPAVLMCLDVATGKRVWRDRSVGSGALTYADGHLYLLSKDFTVALVEATPTAYREKGRFKIAETDLPSYAHPVVSGGRLYIRNQATLTAYDIRAK